MSDRPTNAVRFDGTGASCDAVLALYGGPDPARCLWESCTYDGGFITTPNGACEFVPGDWIVRDDAGGLHVCTAPREYVGRKSGLVRALVFAWLAEEVSEGRMVEATGLDRTMLRTIRDDLVKKGLASLTLTPKGHP